MPGGMSTEPLRFPNLVTGTDRNPAHAARAALYTRYTPYEWTQNSLNNYNEADTNRNFAERLRSDAVRVMRLDLHTIIQFVLVLINYFIVVNFFFNACN